MARHNNFIKARRIQASFVIKKKQKQKKNNKKKTLSAWRPDLHLTSWLRNWAFGGSR